MNAKMAMPRVLVAAFLFLPSLASASGGEAFKHEIPLNIQEVAGVPRKGDVVSTGVPLPCGALKEPEGIAVYGPGGNPVPAQFRVLERWREKGLGRADLSVKWLLVTFFADVAAGKKAVYRLKAGKNPAPAKPVRIEEKGGSFRMGGLEFRKDFTAPFKLVLTDPEGKQIGTEGQKITWSTWERGPLRACLRAESPTDHGKFGFTAWIYAYAGSGQAGEQRWDMTVVLKNTPNKKVGPFYFKDFSVAWNPPEVKGAGDGLLGGEWGKATAVEVGGGRNAYLYQDSDGSDSWEKLSSSSKNKKKWVGAFVMPYMKVAPLGKPRFRGYKVMSNDKELAGGNMAQGWAALSSGGKAALMCVRHFRHNFPKATEVAPGALTARLWPKYWKGHGGLHWLDDCQQKDHDVSFRTLSGKADAQKCEKLARAFDCPLVAHCGVNWYASCKIEMRSVKYLKGRTLSKQEPARSNWVTFGGDTTDRIRRRYHRYPITGFVKTGMPYHGYRTLTSMRHSSGMTPFWVDEYKYPRDKGVIWPGYCTPPRKLSSKVYRKGSNHHGYMAWNPAHFCAEEIFGAWRLFGDPIAFEASRDIATFCQFYVDWRKTSKKLLAGTRADGLPFHNLCEAYRIHGDEALLKSIHDFAEISWKQVDKQRGNYGVMKGWEKSKDEPCEKPFMMAQVMKGIRNYYDLTGDERVVEQISGMCDFIITEAAIGRYGWNYAVPMDLEVQKKRHQQRTADRQKKDPKGRKGEDRRIAEHIAWSYAQTGDGRYKAGLELAGGKLSAYGVAEKTNPPPAPVKDLKAEPIGSGKVKLTWTSPAGKAARYQVKWAARPMVWHLKWPEEKEEHANWWAAVPVSDEPAPAAAGGKQSMVVAGVSPGRRVFAIRTFDAARNRSELSNQVAVEVK